MRMRWLILLVLLTPNLAQAESGSGEHVARPFQVVLAEAWLYNHAVPVYQVTVEHAVEHAELRAAEAAVASVRTEFTNFTSQFVQAIDHYVIGRTDSGTHTTIYIRRSIVADWLITS
jgi:hypothetical protein